MARTYLNSYGGYVVNIDTHTPWQGLELQSTCLGSPYAGLRGSHLVLKRGGHRFAPATYLEPRR